MSSEKTYLFFLPNFSIGGAGNSILRICKTLKKRKNKIVVISLGKNCFRTSFKKIDVDIIELPFSRLLSSIISLREIVSTFLKKKEEKIIFISNINYSNTICCLFLKKFKINKNFKLILFERTPIQELDQFQNFFEFVKKKIIKFLIKYTYKNANFIIGNSTNVSKDLQYLCNQKVLTLNPIVAKSKKIIKKNRIKKMLWIGRNSKEKNLKDLIKSLENLNDLKFEITIISDFFSEKMKNDLKDIYKKKIKLINFGKNDIEKYFKNSDIFISTSIYEGFPNVVAEAISYNCLIITSKSYGGIFDLVKNENYGYMYNSGKIDELSKKIKLSIRNTEKNLIKKRNARKNLNSIYLKNKKLTNFLEKI